MSQNPTPAFVLQHAWGVVRLAKLQAIVNTTISQLEQLDPRELLGRELSSQELGFQQSPVGQALAACCEELRCESGICNSAAAPLPRSAGAEPAWRTAYDEALDRYRRMAAQLLEASFDDKPKRQK